MKIEHWFTGIVENIADPLNAGRVQVRCYEYHELDDVNSVPSENLPWACPLLPITSASKAAVGTSSTGLMVGSWVFGFFRDADQQDPVILASIPGVDLASADIPDDASSSSVGFAHAGATNTSQLVENAPIGGQANTSALDEKPAPQSQSDSNSSAEVNSFVDKVLSESTDENTTSSTRSIGGDNIQGIDDSESTITSSPVAGNNTNTFNPQRFPSGGAANNAAEIAPGPGTIGDEPSLLPPLPE